MESVRELLLGQLAEAEDALVQKVWNRLASSGPYGSLGALAAQDVRATTQWALSTFTACLLARRSLTPQQLARLEEVGAARAKQGIPLSRVREAFRTAHECCYEELVQLADQHPGTGAIEALGAITTDLIQLTDAALDAIIRGYEAAGPCTAHPTGFAEAALAGEAPERQLTEWAAELGLPRVGLWGLVAIVPRCGEVDVVAGAITAVANALPGGLTGQVRAKPVPHGIVLVAGWEGHETAADHVLTPIARKAGVTLLPAVARRLGGVAGAYRNLERPITAVSRVPDPPALVSASEGHLYAMAAHDPPEVTEADVRHTLGGLLDLPDERTERFIQTILALYRAGGCTADASAVLCMTSRNVGLLRAQIRKLIGLDLLRADDLARAGRAAHLISICPGLTGKANGSPSGSRDGRTLPVQV